MAIALEQQRIKKISKENHSTCPEFYTPKAAPSLMVLLPLTVVLLAS